MLYATKFPAPDAFGMLERNGKLALLLSDLEIDRARRLLPDAEIVSLSELEKSVQAGKKRRPSLARVLAAFLKERKANKTLVPVDFPLSLARALRKEGVRVRPAKGDFHPERILKSPEEIRAMTKASRIAEAGMARGFEVLAASKIRKDRKLIWANKILTSEILRIEMESAVLRAGGTARMDTIVTCGDQACDPHERGSGPLLANELIILDIFPRDAKTGYHGDITRTIVRGSANDAQKELWNLCLKGQQYALKELKPGVRGLDVQNAVRELFTNAGYPTELQDGRWRGFFHGLGHGLGLEVHESPRLSTAILEPGMVVTVEPGIYWPGIGGVRHEDVITITPKASRLLTKHPKPLEL